MNELIEEWLKKLGPALEWLNKEGGLAGFFHEVAKTPKAAAAVSSTLSATAKGFDQQIAKLLADFLEAMKLPAPERAKRFAEKELDETTSLDAAAQFSELPAELRLRLDSWLDLARKLEGVKRKPKVPPKVGTAVHHPKFGAGTVKSLDGRSATVEFADGQTLRLDSTYLVW